MATMEETKQWGIGIDCPPFTPRPDVYADYIKNNIYDGVEYEITSKFFGHWEFSFKKGWYPTEEQRKASWDYLTEQYNNGMIRYADQGGL